MTTLKKNWYGVVVAVIPVLVIAFGWQYFGSDRSVTLQPLVHNAPYEVALTVHPSRLTVNEPVRLDFTVRREGKIADIYQDNVVGHYIITSENYRDFFHTFTPEVLGPGQFYLDHTFTQPGRYRVWTELVDTTKSRALHHGEHAEIVSYVDLMVEDTATSAGTIPSTATNMAVGSWRVFREHPRLTAGTPATIRLHVEDGQDKILPVFAEEPAIYVMTGPNLTFFRHTHTRPAVNGTFIEFTETFPAPGKYLLFTEIYVDDGEIYQTVPALFELTVQ